MKYTPQPIDTSDILLPESVLKIADLLSRNVHEVWANQKIRDGFSYGETIDIKSGTHSDLVPYDELSAQTKQYDMNTAMETIKVLISLGFKIEK